MENKMPKIMREVEVKITTGEVSSVVSALNFHLRRLGFPILESLSPYCLMLVSNPGSTEENLRA